VDFAMQRGLHLDTDILRARLIEMGKLGVRSIMFAGEGEPLLHPEFVLLVRTAKENGIDVAITTNGTIGNRELWKEILPHLTWIKFSVDAGSKGVYSRVHNVSADFFERTINSIQEAVEVKKSDNLDTTIGVQFLIIDENINDIENALKLFSAVGVDYFVLKPYSRHPQMMKDKDVVYDARVIDSVDASISSYRDKADMDIIFRQEALEKYDVRVKHYYHCHALPFWGYISAKGDFYTCSVFIGDERFKVGNIYEDNMQEILFGNKRKKSVEYGGKHLDVKNNCRVNCRMARVNEFLEFLNNKPEHINFV
jgi:radical SAM protein with 4Fe4S-binding SPASM domain